jgi:hypothetical protein
VIPYGEGFYGDELDFLLGILQLMVPAESAHGTIAALGEVGMLQFKDLNADKSAFQRTFANHVRAPVVLLLLLLL